MILLAISTPPLELLKLFKGLRTYIYMCSYLDSGSQTVFTLLVKVVWLRETGSHHCCRPICVKVSVGALQTISTFLLWYNTPFHSS